MVVGQLIANVSCVIPIVLANNGPTWRVLAAMLNKKLELSLAVGQLNVVTISIACTALV